MEKHLSKYYLLNENTQQKKLCRNEFKSMLNVVSNYHFSSKRRNFVTTVNIFHLLLLKCIFCTFPCRYCACLLVLQWHNPSCSRYIPNIDCTVFPDKY